MATFSRIFSMCLRLLGASPQTLTGALPLEVRPSGPILIPGYAPDRTITQLVCMSLQGGAKKWNIHTLCRYLLSTGFVFVDH